MYLKRLEILGFKSFADKIKLAFLPGVTGIVGPNGSGKSNISDALRWVLGEQSVRNLRGNKMDDVIFSGTQVRKALGLAEVTMVLDNSDHAIPLDFTEVSITRKLFRSGESEYLINKSQVRLKDVYELFYDTGLGKDAYSVIGQGKIDSILSAKAEERRSIFEEAAGIIKYKTRKQVAERKLEDTEKHLVRVHDIINELQNQLEPLSAQAELAEKFLAMKKTLSETEINHYGKIIVALRDDLNSLTDKQRLTLENFQNFEGEEALIESELENFRLALLNIDNLINSLNENFFKVQSQIEKYVEQLGFLDNKSEDLTHQIEEQQVMLQNNVGRKELLLVENAKVEEELAAITLNLSADDQLLKESESALLSCNEAMEALEQQEQQLKDEVFEVLNRLSALKNKQSNETVQKEFLERQIEECCLKQKTLQRQKTDVTDTISIKKEALDDCDQTLEMIMIDQSNAGRKVGTLKRNLLERDGKNQEYQRQLRVFEGKISLLEDMEKGFQGYFQGVKFLLADAASESFHSKIHGIIADLIKVKPGMELALETAFGSGLQHIVIEDDRAAQSAIEFLKKNHKGRATFLPLNQVRASEEKDRKQILQQFSCDSALSLLEFDAKYRDVLGYMLHQVVVAPNLRAAIDVSAKLDRGYKIVTPEGDLVNAGGSITGGSNDRQRIGLLSRKREIDDLVREKNRLQELIDDGIKEIKEIQAEMTENEQDLNESRAKEQETRLNRVSLEKELQTAEQDSQRIIAELKLLDEQLVEFDAERLKFADKKEELLKAITESECQQEKLELQQAELLESIKNARVKKETEQERLSEVRSKLSAARQEISGKEALKANYTKQLNEMETNDSGIEAKIAELTSAQANVAIEKKELEEKIIAEKVNLNKEEEKLGSERTTKEELQGKIKEFETKQRSYRRKNNDFQNQLHRLELDIAKQTAEIENTERNLSDDYGFGWEQQIQLDWESPEGIEEKISQLKEDIRALGPVNVAAIDEFKQVTERCEFLNNQSNDLEQARESLNKVINEIERTIEKRFLETFQEIKVEFKKLFGELFQGGSADLYLQDPDSPLDSGIEIVAQPPGKKLQGLSLLSGGERAMTAIALLFAILSIKPSPFCILDEIDATLDEANVQRFAKLLDIFSQRLQFIVVTHRRGTMEAANTLYGVTMEELGISKLISLSLADAKFDDQVS